MKFVTLYPEGSNTELIKDVGQIPYFLSRDYNFESTCVFFNINKEGTNTQYVKGVILKKIPLLFRGRIGIFLSKVLYLIKESRKIDWLNLYHLDRENSYLIKIYKFLNPHGHVFLKLDLDLKGCKLYETNLKWRRTLQFVVSKADLVTVETEKVKNLIQKYISKDIRVLNDGFRKVEIDNKIRYHKKNVFVTVARLGSKQKDTITLLKAFAKSADEQNWNLKLIGTCTKDFKNYVNDFFKSNPSLKYRIEFKGKINDRKQLYSEYAESKVFVLDSRWESFGLVLPEALNQGCTLIVSDQVPPAKEITNNGKYGQIIRAHNIDVLCAALIKATKDTSFLKNNINERVNYADQHFAWDNICKKLYKYLKEY